MVARSVHDSRRHGVRTCLDTALTRFSHARRSPLGLRNIAYATRPSRRPAKGVRHRACEPSTPAAARTKSTKPALFRGAPAPTVPRQRNRTVTNLERIRGASTVQRPAASTSVAQSARQGENQRGQHFADSSSHRRRSTCSGETGSATSKPRIARRDSTTQLRHLERAAHPSDSSSWSCTPVAL